MGPSSGAVDALSILLWATFLPVIIVLVMRRKDRPDAVDDSDQSSTTSPESQIEQADEKLPSKP